MEMPKPTDVTGTSRAWCPMIPGQVKPLFVTWERCGQQHVHR
jgi:hypothetical protein